MRIRKPFTAAAAAAVLAATGALLAPAAASAHSATHTLKFTSEMRKFVNFTKTTFAQADNDVSSASKIIGFDEVNVAIGKTTNRADIVFDLNGGLLDGTLTISSTGTATGPVTGGTGSFSGATGTITGKSAGRNKEAITITYSS